jgi:hypothetical protein
MLALTTISCTKGTAYERFTSCSSYSMSNKRNTYVESMQTMNGPQGHQRRRATKRVVRFLMMRMKKATIIGESLPW